MRRFRVTREDVMIALIILVFCTTDFLAAYFVLSAASLRRPSARACRSAHAHSLDTRNKGQAEGPPLRASRR